MLTDSDCRNTVEIDSAKKDSQRVLMAYILTILYGFLWNLSSFVFKEGILYAIHFFQAKQCCNVVTSSKTYLE